MKNRINRLRRWLMLSSGVALGAGLSGEPWTGLRWMPDAHAQTAARDEPGGPRLALLLGNREYPKPYDLPPIHKNVRDLNQALVAKGFRVFDSTDLSLGDMRRMVDTFIQTVQAAPDATVFFYFSGHGMQQNAENLLVPVDLAPNVRREVLVESSMRLAQDIVTRLSNRPKGVLIAVIDACRTDIKAALAAEDGLNQVEAPPGCMIVFSTGAGRPAISPDDENKNTFFTASLLKMFNEVPENTNFSELFRLVRQDVQNTMLNHPLKPIRDLAQRPFIAENTRQVPFVLPESKRKAQRKRDLAQNETDDLKRLQEAFWPQDILAMSTKFITDYPDSPSLSAAVVSKLGSQEALTALRNREVKLFKSAFADLQARADLADDVRKAGRGDKDAAARIGRKMLASGADAKEQFRYEGWMQYAAFLGNGIASYELALHYRASGQVLLAGQYESKARDLGYTPPPSLDHARK